MVIELLELCHSLPNTNKGREIMGKDKVGTKKKVHVLTDVDNELTISMEKEKLAQEDDHHGLPESMALSKKPVFADVLGKQVLLTTVSPQLNLLGQVFRPIFCGRVTKVAIGFITLDPVTIKMSNAPFFQFPTPLNFPIELISNLALFNCETRFPIP